jgi:hypothetical protein
MLLILAACTGTDKDDLVSKPDEAPAGDATSGAGSLKLTVPRAVHKATVLNDGRVLFTGGCTLPGCEGFDQAQASEIFDPVSRRFSKGPSMASPRAGHTATLLEDGRVLLVGGYPGEGRQALAAVEVFDPRSNEFHLVDSLSGGRADHTATVLKDGSVLIAGGTTGAGDALATTEVFDPQTGRFKAGPTLSSRRSGHAAVLSGARLVLVGGTADFDSALATTDVLDDGTWNAGPQLRQVRVKHAAIALPDGTVLVIGGGTDVEGRELLSSTEVLNLGSARSRPGPPLSEGQYKLEGAVTRLTDGRVVVAGGQRLDVYDPVSAEMSVVAGESAPRRSFVSASTVAASTVLVAGGYDSSISPTAEARLVRID